MCNKFSQISSHTGVAYDVVQDDKSFELTLKTLQSSRRQRLSLKLAQPEFCVFEPVDKQLQRSDLQSQLLNSNVPMNGPSVWEYIIGEGRGQISD